MDLKIGISKDKNALKLTFYNKFNLFLNNNVMKNLHKSV